MSQPREHRGQTRRAILEGYGLGKDSQRESLSWAFGAESEPCRRRRGREAGGGKA